MSAEAPVAEALQASPEEVGVKVFVGNLAFATTGEDIKDAFKSSGEILDAQVITRGSRSLGYGFVTFKDKDDAAKAVSKFDKSDLGGRAINVEIAKPAKAARGGGVAQAAADAAGGEAGATRGRGRPRRGGRSARGGRQAKTDGDVDGEPVDGVDGITAGVDGLSTEDGAKRGGRPARGRGRGRGARSTGPREPVGPPAGEPSKTLIFVANLPFSLDDEGLKAIFTGYTVQSSKVVVRKFGHAAGRSKGFGFVELGSEDEQKRAVEQFHGKEVDTAGGKRELSVKVAINAAPRDAEEGEAAPAAAEGAAAQ